MLHGGIIRWVVGCWTQVRLSRRKTLGELVFGAMRCRRVSLADIGRSLRTGAPGAERRRGNRRRILTDLGAVDRIGRRRACGPVQGRLKWLLAAQFVEPLLMRAEKKTGGTGGCAFVRGVLRGRGGGWARPRLSESALDEFCDVMRTYLGHLRSKRLSPQRLPTSPMGV